MDYFLTYLHLPLSKNVLIFAKLPLRSEEAAKLKLFPHKVCFNGFQWGIQTNVFLTF